MTPPEQRRPNQAPERTVTAATFRTPSGTDFASRDRDLPLTLGTGIAS